MSIQDLETYADRAFSFYPAIVNVQHNEWRYQKSTWSEVLVRNTESAEEIWVPRRYLGEVSGIEQAVMVVGLNRELEYRGGGVWPRTPGVVDLPDAPKQAARPSAAPPPPRTRRETPTERRIQRFVLASLGIFIALSALIIFLTRSRESGGTIIYQNVVQQDLGLTSRDGYSDVVRIVGEPAASRWRSDAGERQFQALDYPDRGLTLILMGTDREDQRYIGAKDEGWRTVQFVVLTDGADTASILRTLPRF